MSESTEAVSAAPAPTTPKKAPKKAAANKPRVKPNHPPAAEMVNAALASLKEKNGSSLQAIKKYIAASYKVDTDKQATFIRKYLKSAVAKGAITQTKGTGASGRFKLAEKTKKSAVAVKKPVARKAKAASPKKPKAAVKKTPSGEKKEKAAPKKVVKKAPTAAKPKVAKPATKAKAPAKAKKPKSPVKKSPKPKKAAPKARPAKK